MSILVVLFYLRTHMQFFTFEPSSRLSSWNIAQVPLYFSFGRLWLND
jgi:hypothetical protein